VLCCYCVLSLTGSLLSSDGSLVVGGFADSSIRVWDLIEGEERGSSRSGEGAPMGRVDEKIFPSPIQRPLPSVKATATPSGCVRLIGHSGRVHGCSLSPDSSFLLSASEDASIRLWHLPTATNLVAYRGHSFPVWDVDFGPMGYHFASAAHDCTSRLWSTDRVVPLRLFVGHSSDVDVVRFHPNCHYLATGSCDRSIRLWDVGMGQSVRVLMGHRAEVTSLTFDSEGRYLYSAAADGGWIQWDLTSARVIAQGNASHGAVSSLSVSGEGSMLAVGDLSGTVSVWGINRGAQEGAVPAMRAGRGREGGGGAGQPLQSWRAKTSSITHLHFSPRNLLMVMAAWRGG